jgi:predicted RecA/RadA family phage recombinase
MSVNFIEEGEKMTFTATAAYNSGDLVNLGNGYFGIADNDIANGAVGSASVEGVFEVPKDSSDFTSLVGTTATLYVVTASKALSVSSGSAVLALNVRIWEAAGVAATVVKVKLI